MLNKQIECTKEVWFSFFNKELTGIDLHVIFSFLEKENLLSKKVADDSVFNITIHSVVKTKNKLDLYISGQPSITVLCSELDNLLPNKQKLKLPKKINCSYPGSKHFKTKKFFN